MSKKCIAVVFIIFALAHGFAVPNKKSAVKNLNVNRNQLFATPHFISSITAKAVAVKAGKHVATSAPKVAAGVAASSLNDVIAKVFGYLLGAGSMLVYTPIILNLLKTKNSEGYSVATWVYNLLGLAVALIYPFKKAFPLSTYIEILILTIQSAGILGLVCKYQNLLNEYALGMAAFSAATAAVVFSPAIPPKLLQSLQLLAIVVCNYANIPQILLTFKTKKASWSWITASMSMAGNIIRIFTTMQLTQDLLVMSGNLLGVLTNAILLFQVFYYQSPKN